AIATEAATPIGNNFNSSSNGSGYSVEQIEEIVRTGAPDGANRSNLFHTIVGHYVGCSWDAERILQHLQQFPGGIGGRYLSEGRLGGEIARSASKYAAAPVLLSNGWSNGVEAKAPPQPEAPAPPQRDPKLEDDPELEDDPDLEDEDQGSEPDPKLPAL